MVDEFTLIVDQYRRIPKAPYTGPRSFVEPYMSPDVVLCACLLQRADLGPVDVETLGSETVEEGVVVDWGGEGGPEGISVCLSDESDLSMHKEVHFSTLSSCQMFLVPWNVRFRKDNEVCGVVGRFADETDGF